MKFESIDLTTFPAEECSIPLRLNGNFFRSSKKRLVMIKDIKEDTLIFKNLYPCLGESDGHDIFGFVGNSELEFYNLDNQRFIVEGFKNTQEIESVIDSFKEETE